MNQSARVAQWVAVAALIILTALPGRALAGDMDWLGAYYAIFMASVVIAGLVCVGVFWGLRGLANVRLRAVLRLALVVLFAAPVPIVLTQDHIVIAPAILLWTQSLWYVSSTRVDVAQQMQTAAPAFVIVFLLFLPLVLAWAGRADRNSVQRDRSLSK